MVHFSTTRKRPFALKYGEIIQNTAILGRSGAGKTNVTFHILSQLIEKKIPFIFKGWDVNELAQLKLVLELTGLPESGKDLLLILDISIVYPKNNPVVWVVYIYNTIHRDISRHF